MAPHVLQPPLSVAAPTARGGEGNIPGNSLGHGFTSLSTFSYVQGASGAQTGAVEGAASGQK